MDDNNVDQSPDGTKEEDRLEHTFSFLIDRTARMMKQFAQKKFNEFDLGITVDQWAILACLWENENISQTEIADATFKDPPTVTRMLDLIEEKELVQRVPDEHDRRRYNIVLTSRGREKVKKLLPYIQKGREIGRKNLTDEDLNELKRILNIIYENYNQ